MVSVTFAFLFHTQIKHADDLTADDIEGFFKEAQSLGGGSNKEEDKLNDEDYYDLINVEGDLDNDVSRAIVC